MKTAERTRKKTVTAEFTNLLEVQYSKHVQLKCKENGF